MAMILRPWQWVAAPRVTVVTIGVVIGAAFLHPGLWWLVFIGSGWLFLCVKKLPSLSRAALFGWGVGTIKSLVVLAWFWSAYPMDWLGFTNHWIQISLVFIYWMPAALTIGSGYLLLAGSLFWLRYRSSLTIAVGGAAVWVVADVLGALVFSVYTLGPGSSLNGAFSFGFLGYPLAAHPWGVLVALAGGVYALTFVTAVSSIIGARLFECRYHLTLVLVAAVLGGTYFITPGSIIGTDTLGYRIAVVNTSFDKDVSMRGEDWQLRQSTLHEVTAALSQTSFTHVVFPEDVRYRELLPVTFFESNYTNRFGSPVVVVDTARVDTATSTVLRAFVTDREGRLVTYDKQYLVPQGEYVPYAYRLLARVFGMNDELAEVMGGTNYQPGASHPSAEPVTEVPQVLFCFESVNPLGVYSQVKHQEAKPPFVAHAVSHAWFNHQPHSLWHQLDLMLRTQAVWNQLPIVQAGNETANKVYWPTGQHQMLPADVVGERWHISFVSL